MDAHKADLIIENARILTVNDNFDEYPNGLLAVKNGKITYAGSKKNTARFECKTKIDARSKLLIPGFVNAHTHSAMTVFRGIADDIALHEWLNDYIFPLEKNCVSAELVKKGSLLAIAEMISTGTTCFNDMYYFSDETAQAADAFGMRCILSEGLIDFKSPNTATPEEGMAYSLKLHEKFKNNDLINIGIAAHAPYTCSDKLLKQAAELAAHNDMNFHIHLAETKREYDDYMSKKQMSPTAYLNRLGILSERFVAAHAVWMDDKDLQLIKNSGAGIAHNPECNMKIASGAARIPEILDMGIKVGLGTDGTASNNNLDMMQEMHSFALLHKLTSKDATVIDARQALKTATLGGAEVMNIAHRTGSIEPGKDADFVLIDTSSTAAVPMYDPYSALVYSLQSQSVTDVFIAGKHIYQNRKFPNQDIGKIKLDVLNLAEEIVRRLRK